jgi:hypothetical protein
MDYIEWKPSKARWLTQIFGMPIIASRKKKKLWNFWKKFSYANHAFLDLFLYIPSPHGHNLLFNRIITPIIMVVIFALIYFLRLHIILSNFLCWIFEFWFENVMDLFCIDLLSQNLIIVSQSWCSCKEKQTIPI